MSKIVSESKSDPGKYLITIIFDYEGHDSLTQLTSAMSAFSDAFGVYAGKRKVDLKVESIENGSVQIAVSTDIIGWEKFRILQDDLSVLERGRRSVFMPEGARRHFLKLLRNTNSLALKTGEAKVDLNEHAIPLLDYSARNQRQRPSEHIGLVDKIDLKANTFRIVLPSGHRINCGPALDYVNELSKCLDSYSLRIKVKGEGKYSSSAVLPNRIQVDEIALVEERIGFADLVLQVSERINKEKIAGLLKDQESRMLAILREMEANEPS